ncbi:pyrroline-5-carboxylate reductase [Adhaeribacter pallidiroseus]|uniref:Pyrroline-5-carboxylate reductase n=1 Tax=Adhaeribacter pallidiroseus TaxID=2072847 RepID=A0A369QH76_9BACT|nr:pyrroline-5-carboxylate reductase [Adhaeribacter pallidiroseus]RDC62925.1 Pyrroline-5-carboxylate reductase [Adhaeribacter pallidiroseus]
MSFSTNQNNIAILGGGNIGIALAKGLVKSGKYNAEQITITRRNVRSLQDLTNQGFGATDNNAQAVQQAGVVVIAVLPQQLDGLLDVIREAVDPEKHVLISVVSGVSVADITKRLVKQVQVVRAMPNTAIAIQESMTCLASNNATKENMALVKDMFDTVGETIEIHEELMTAATALCACGIAFFLRSIRAASQGGTEIGFHAAEALHMAAQTAKGAAALLLATGNHPEGEIDKVTSPKGCTIAGLNEMEHAGFSSAMIKGIRLSAQKAGDLYVKSN